MRPKNCNCVTASISLLLIVAVSQSWQQDLDYVPVPNLDLQRRSFQLNSRLTITPGKDSRLTFELDESHSAWQRRSKLSFRVYGRDNAKEKLNLAARSNVIYASEQELLMVSQRKNSCLDVDHDYIDSLFNRNVLWGFDSGNLIGAARLLLFVELNFSKFTLAHPADNPTGKKFEKIIRYDGQFRNSAKEQFTLMLIYNADGVNNLPNGIPRKILIKTAGGAIVAHEFTRYASLANEFKLDSASLDGESSSGFVEDTSAVRDTFMFPPAIGCSRSANGPKGDSPSFSSYDHFRFSFNARPVTDRGIGPIDYLVAFEPYLSVLRIDQVQPTRAVTSLTDFERNRSYQIIQRLSGAPDLVFDRIVTANEQERSCVANRVEAPASVKESPYSLGRMLLGTNRLFYLGLARVRGIEARVYEWHDCDLPVWLQQPAVYEQFKRAHLKTADRKDAQGQLSTRNEAKIIKERGFSITNVLYFSNVGPEEEDLLKANLLLIEVLIKIDRTGHVFKQHTFSVFDFSWDLPNTCPAGGRHEDSFSLMDDCLAEMDRSEFVRVDMLLEARLNVQNQAWLQSRSTRNLALMQMARNQLAMKGLLAFDIQSRLLVFKSQAEESADNQFALLPLSFRAARRTKSVARLVYAGRAFVRQQNVDLYQAFSFQLCHMLAAQRKRDTVFAYEAPESGCYLLNSDQTGEPATLMDENFELSDRGSAEVFLVLHEDNMPLRVGDRVDGIALMRRKLSKTRKLVLSDPASLAAADSSSVLFLLKRLHVGSENDESGYDLDDLHLNGANKFPGLGLVESDEQNKLVEPRWSEDPGTKNYHQEVMSFEHCQTACLADIECRSFSLCLVQGEQRCVLSSVSFSPPSMVLQLMLLLEKPAKFGERFSVSVDLYEQTGTSHSIPHQESTTRTLQVMKHPVCELHNKIYQDFFVKTRYIIASGSTSALRAVTNLEACAELCYVRTVQFLRREAQLSRQTSPTEASQDSAQRDEEAEADGLCAQFLYGDRQTLLVQDPAAVEQIDKHLQTSDLQDTPRGYCIMSERRQEAGSPNWAKYLSNKEFVLNEFNFAALYAKQPDVTMVHSPRLTGPTKSEATPDPNDNFGDVHEGLTAQECAKICYTKRQILDTPACRSFDYIEVIKSNVLIRRRCVFHSVTLRSTLRVERFDLIRRGADKQEAVILEPDQIVRLWHYDPREGIVANSLDQIYKIGTGGQRAAEASLAVRFHSFSMFCVVVLALSLGLIFGLALGSRLTNRTTSADNENLITDLQLDVPAIHFSNMVNYEGQIAGREPTEEQADTSPKID